MAAAALRPKRRCARNGAVFRARGLGGRRHKPRRRRPRGAWPAGFAFAASVLAPPFHLRSCGKTPVTAPLRWRIPPLSRPLRDVSLHRSRPWQLRNSVEFASSVRGRRFPIPLARVTSRRGAEGRSGEDFGMPLRVTLRRRLLFTFARSAPARRDRVRLCATGPVAPPLLLRRARPFAPSAVGPAAGNKSERTRPQGRRVRKPRGDSISVGMGGQRRRLPTRGDPADEVHSASVAAHPMAAPRAEVSRPSVRVPYERKVVRKNNRGGTANVARGPTGPPRSVIAPPAVSAPAERRPRPLFSAAAHPAFA